MIRYLPPAGHKISQQTILKCFPGNIGAGKKAIDYICQKFGFKHAFLVSSGRAALYIILKGLSEGLNSKKEVIIPAYTCPSVAAAVIRAGLTVKLCDLSEDGMGFDLVELQKCISKKTLAVIFVEFYGFKGNILDVKKICSDENIYLLEDAAQAYGVNDAGKIGDIGFFSFGRGKSLSVSHGGLIVTSSDELASKLNQEYIKLSISGIKEDIKLFLKVFAFSIFFNPSLFWIPKSIPSLKLGETTFELDYPVSRIGRFSASLLLKLLGKAEKISNERSLVCQNILKALELSGFDFFYPLVDNMNSNSSPVRLPLIIKDVKIKHHLLDLCNAEGIGATGQYPVPLNKQSGLSTILNDEKLYPNACYIAEHILTLPVHEYVSDKDIGKIVKLLGKFAEK